MGNYRPIFWNWDSGQQDSIFNFSKKKCPWGDYKTCINMFSKYSYLKRQSCESSQLSTTPWYGRKKRKWRERKRNSNFGTRGMEIINRLEKLIEEINEGVKRLKEKRKKERSKMLWTINYYTKTRLEISQKPNDNNVKLPTASLLLSFCSLLSDGFVSTQKGILHFSPFFDPHPLQQPIQSYIL